MRMFSNQHSKHQKSSKKGAAKQDQQQKVVQSVRFPISAETGKINGIDFVFSTNNIESNENHSTTGSSTPASRVFVLQPPHEYIVCVRYNELAGELTGVQVQTNLGRRSRFYYGLTSSEEKQHAQRLGTRGELYAPRGEAIIGFLDDATWTLSTKASQNGELKEIEENTTAIKQNDAKKTTRFHVQTGPIPHIKRKKLRKLLLMPSVRTLLLKSNEATGKSAASQMFRGGRKAVAMHAVRHGLAGKMLAAGEDGDALIRLILDGEQRNIGSMKRDSIHSNSAASTVSALRSTTRRISTLFSSSRKPDSESDNDDHDGEEEDFDEQAIDEMFGEESISFPPSILRALCEAGPNLGISLLDLFSAGRERDGRPPLLRVFFESGVAKIIFRRKKGTNECLAELMMTPDRIRGLRSLMQLMTDDEALDDPNRPSLLRSLLIGEERGDRPSVLRLMLLKTPGRAVTSLMDELLKGEDEFDSCARRLMIETEERPMSLSRLFFSDTPGGKPALAKYVFGGESDAEPHRPSLMRLMVQGEAREQNSLLRLLIGFRGSSNKSLLDLLTCGQPSLMDLLMKGEETAQETSLGRLMLGTTFTIQNGRLVMGSALGSSSNVPPPAALVSRLTMSDEENKTETDHLKKRLERGLTISKAFMLGEEDGGPGISIMRVLLMGEEQGLSVLRLLLTGEESNEVSPLRIIFTGLHTAFVVAQVAADSSKQMQTESLLEIATQPKRWGEALQKITWAVVDSINESHQVGGSWRDSFDKLIELGRTRLRTRDAWQENIAFLYTAFARVRSMGPEFAKTWKKQWTIVSKEIRLTGERVRRESAWKQLAPVIAVLTESIAEQHWQKVFVDVAHIIQAVEVAAGRQTDKNFAKVVSVMDEIFNWAPKWF